MRVQGAAFNVNEDSPLMPIDVRIKFDFFVSGNFSALKLLVLIRHIFFSVIIF